MGDMSRRDEGHLTPGGPYAGRESETVEASPLMAPIGPGDTPPRHADEEADDNEPKTDETHSTLPTQRPKATSPSQRGRSPNEVLPPAKSPRRSPMTANTPPQEGTFAGLLAEARHGAPGTAARSTLSARAASQKRAPAPAPALARAPARTSSRTGATTGSESPSNRRIGPYQVLAELGQGGMAVVYKAIQPSLDRVVAIKTLRAEYVHDRQVAARFEREATSLATLQHTNIVHIYDYLQDPESAHIVMEYVEGIDLFDVLSSVDGLPEEIAVIIAAQVVEGLEYAHYRGIIHRDIKPSNILISKNGEVKIMDFGIARDPGKSELTQIGLSVGTPAYMAPEQIRGDRIDFRTDVFALGIVLYEMLAGTKPWAEEDGRSVTVKVLDEDYPRLSTLRPGIAPDLARIVDRCLRKDANERYATTYALRRDLFAFLNRTVPIDPRGRLVLFLRNRGFVDDTEISSVLPARLLEDPALRRRDAGIPVPPARDILRPITLAYGLAAMVVALATVSASHIPWGERLPRERPHPAFAQANNEMSAGAGEPVEAARHSAPSRSDERQEAGGPTRVPSHKPARDPTHPTQSRAPLEANRHDGFLALHVEPWARVYVDGVFFDTTPFADPIPLTPGSHTIGLRNPYFVSVDRVLEIAADERKTLRVTLLPRDDDHAEEEPPQ
ncbi:MAG: serine/threonine protein kinase [Deltaproteobacteria bacterium]|nr:serine/threonine protein kinase [Deltaproteobacteria bacterium]